MCCRLLFVRHGSAGTPRLLGLVAVDAAVFAPICRVCLRLWVCRGVRRRDSTTRPYPGVYTMLVAALHWWYGAVDVVVHEVEWVSPSLGCPSSSNWFLCICLLYVVGYSLVAFVGLLSWFSSP